MARRLAREEGVFAGVSTGLNVLAALPDRFAALLKGQNPSARHPDLSWSAGAYVCHVADNLRIYAERLAGMALGSEGPLVPYDQDELARVRRYGEMALPSVLWSVERAAADWCEAAQLVDPGLTAVTRTADPRLPSTSS